MGDTIVAISSGEMIDYPESFTFNGLEFLKADYYYKSDEVIISEGLITFYTIYQRLKL